MHVLSEIARNLPVWQTPIDDVNKNFETLAGLGFQDQLPTFFVGLAAKNLLCENKYGAGT